MPPLLRFWVVISENRRCLPSCGHPVMQRRVREGWGRNGYGRKLVSIGKSFPLEPICCYEKKPQISPFIVRVPFLPQGTPNLGELLSLVIHLHIWRIWNIAEPSLPGHITALPYNKAHPYSWSLGFDFYFWTTECNPIKNGFWNFLPGKRINTLQGRGCLNEDKLQ